MEIGLVKWNDSKPTLIQLLTIKMYSFISVLYSLDCGIVKKILTPRINESIDTHTAS
jgi:hypothetical protein